MQMNTNSKYRVYLENVSGVFPYALNSSVQNWTLELKDPRILTYILFIHEVAL